MSHLLLRGNHKNKENLKWEKATEKYEDPDPSKEEEAEIRNKAQILSSTRVAKASLISEGEKLCCDDLKLFVEENRLENFS